MVDPTRKRAFTYVLLAACAPCVMVLAACEVEANANVKASGSANESSASASVEETTASSTPPAAGEPAGSATPSTQPSTPPAACPLSCFEAQGPTRVMVTEGEQTQLRTALEPVLGKMRACSSPEEWRRRGSPTVHLRVAPDGTLADLGVDPQHDRDTTCMNSAAFGANPTISLPGRKTVRCVERCAPEPKAAAPAAAPRKRKK